VFFNSECVKVLDVDYGLLAIVAHNLEVGGVRWLDELDECLSRITEDIDRAKNPSCSKVTQVDGHKPIS
jgi:hypothetical protein